MPSWQAAEREDISRKLGTKAKAKTRDINTASRGERREGRKQIGTGAGQKGITEGRHRLNDREVVSTAKYAMSCSVTKRRLGDLTSSEKRRSWNSESKLKAAGELPSLRGQEKGCRMNNLTPRKSWPGTMPQARKLKKNCKQASFKGRTHICWVHKFL